MTDTAKPFRLHCENRGGQRRFAVVNVADLRRSRAVRAFEYSFCHVIETFVVVEVLL